MKQVNKWYVAALFFATMNTTSCGPSSTKEEEQQTQQPVTTNTSTSGDTDVIAIEPPDRSLDVNQTTTPGVSDPTIAVEEETYTMLNLNEVTIPVEFYEAEEITVPNDSILSLAGVEFSGDEDENQITLQGDESRIPDEIVVTWKKGKGKMTKYGITKDIGGKKMTIENDAVFVDGKEVVIDNPVKSIRIGVPKGNPIAIKGKDINITSDVKLGDVTVNMSGKSNLSFDAKSISQLEMSGTSSIQGSYTWVGNITATESARATFSNCDSIWAIIAKNKSLINVPKSTKITKEKTSGDAEVALK